MGDIVVGIDIGTSKVCTLIGQFNKNNDMTILGKGIESCNGLKKGMIVDIESTAASIRGSLEKAEDMANLKVGSAYVNIMGVHVNITNNISSIAISKENREITTKDIERIFYVAKDVEISDDNQIIDVIPKSYIVDNHSGIVDPIGMVGTKLGIDADVVSANTTSVQNIVKSMSKANLNVDGIVVESLAVGEVALTVEEKEMGVVLIDVGGGITNISVFEKNELVFCGAVPVGGDNITTDVSVGLKVSYAEAEKLKKEYEIALTSLINNDQDISVTDINDGKRKNIKVSEVVEIIEARLHEIFVLCRNLLQKSDLLGNYAGSMVLTGCGISYVDGCTQLANHVFGIPVRVAVYKAEQNFNSECATAVGIIKYTASQRRGGSNIGSEVRLKRKLKSEGRGHRMIARLFKLLNNMF